MVSVSKPSYLGRPDAEWGGQPPVVEAFMSKWGAYIWSCRRALSAGEEALDPSVRRCWP